jgi:hypothetical protein
MGWLGLASKAISCQRAAGWPAPHFRWPAAARSLPNHLERVDSRTPLIASSSAYHGPFLMLTSFLPVDDHCAKGISRLISSSIFFTIVV